VRRIIALSIARLAVVVVQSGAGPAHAGIAPDVRQHRSQHA
jgi:hypothetical protein